MIVGSLHQVTGTGHRFVYALRELDRGWNTGPLHFGNGHVTIGFDVLFYGIRVLRLRIKRSGQ
jgi:hypothetical protein